MVGLSKKQQKAQAFRAKQKAKADAIPDVPEADVDLAAEVDEEAVAPVPEGKRKRKREGDEDEEDKEKKDEKKGAKKDTKGKGKKKEGDEDEDEEKPKKSKESKQRFILFIGNLGFKTTSQEVAALFAKEIGRTPSVRLLTEKATKPRQVPKSRGIAFLELATSSELQTCLRLHHTQLAGRRINVELTAGGGGKSEVRKGKLAERNKRIGGQRERRAEREKEEGGEEEAAPSFGEGRAGGWGDRQKKEGGEDGEAPDGFKMRNGRRVKVGPKDDGRPSKRPRQDGGWGARSGGGGGGGGGGAPRKRWEPTGANAVSVG